MSIKFMLKALETKVGNPARKLVLIKLCDNANDSGECWPSHAHIAAHCEMTTRSVITHINTLEADGFLSIRKRKGLKGNDTNVYTLTFPRGEKSSLPEKSAHPRGEDISLTPSENISPPDNTALPRGANISPPSENSSPTPSENISHGTCHSFEPVIKEEEGASSALPSNIFSLDRPLLNKFPMTLDWQPSHNFAGQCGLRGINLSQLSTDEQEDLISEFRSYWMTQSSVLNQAGWEHKLIASLKRSQERRTAVAHSVPQASKRAAVTAAIMNIEDTDW